MREILDEMRRQFGQERGGALVTVIHTTGSVYRREGAKMVCRPDGELIGSISGGCLESDVYEVSVGVVEQNRPEIVTYDTNAENENVWGLGLGCNGTVEVLVEPLAWWRTPDGRALFEAVTAHVDAGRRCGIATVLSESGQPPVGMHRVLLGEDGSVVGDGGTPVDGIMLQRLREALPEPGPRPSRRVTVAGARGALEVFVDVLVPPTRLIVVGGGHDAIPLVRMAREVGFVVTLVDSRPQFATHERFPDADSVVCAAPEEFAQLVPLAKGAAVVLMTHNYLRDREVLKQLLSSSAQFMYLGALGPRVRTEQMLSEIQSDGVTLSPERIAQVHTPIGLDLGADAPAEIALAVLAELLAVRNRRDAIPLRDKKGRIHKAA
jgi:xanthine/CO dehydrogenase XdhC/CoxF family maturation factor